MPMSSPVPSGPRLCSFIVEGTPPSKKNMYEIHWVPRKVGSKKNPILYSGRELTIEQGKELLSKKSRRSKVPIPAPSDEVKAYEDKVTKLATKASLELGGLRLESPILMHMVFHVRRGQDVDNVPAAICDGLKKSILIPDDADLYYGILVKQPATEKQHVKLMLMEMAGYHMEIVISPHDQRTEETSWELRVMNDLRQCGL